MNEKNLLKVKKMATEAGYDSIKLLGKWKGYSVFEPFFDDDIVRYMGYPQYLLVKGADVRWSGDWRESLSIMKTFIE